MTLQAILKRNPKNSGVEFKVWLPYDKPFRGRTHHSIGFKGLVHDDIANLIAKVPTDEAVRQGLLKLAADLRAKERSEALTITVTNALGADQPPKASPKRRRPRRPS